MLSQIRIILIGCIILVALSGLFQKANAATEEEMRATMQNILDALNAHDVAQMSLYHGEKEGHVLLEYAELLLILFGLRHQLSLCYI